MDTKGEMGYSFGVVILNYCTYEITCNCVESYINNAEKNINVVIVDNGSPDLSGRKLAQKYSDNKNAHVIENHENVGFSKGMNIGLAYAKNELKCDFIIISNSDIELKTKNYLSKIEWAYEHYKFAVLGPYIDNLNDESNEKNPYLVETLTLDEKYKKTKRKLLIRKIRLLLAYIYLDSLWDLFLEMIRLIYESISVEYKEKRKISERRKEAEKNICQNTALHGSVFVLSPIYHNTFNGLLEVTFLYEEEWLLYNQCAQENLKMLYYPEIKVLHNGGGGNSLKKLYSQEHNRHICKLKQQNNSDKQILQYIANYRKNGID
ncbi:glycosyltransferase [Butyrivibrio sp. CB08]|uniref:glycosyltransferase n=1 Tax=Butyrivibrio sp. CB08 TaxID=2364879 RepID=UPI001313FADF|nr:glycosyltransferase [Butyrivibrio sp. CB08]